MLRSRTALGAGLLVLGLAGGAPALDAGDALPAPESEAVRSYLANQDYRESWPYWPGKDQLYRGQDPHGAYLTTYVSPAAYQALVDLEPGEQMPRGSFIVKESRDPNLELSMVSVMYKAPAGYAPEHNDWYWLKVVPGTAVIAAGEEGRAERCQGCHQISDRDYLRTALP
jgi:hypothetical protein